jgi:malonyl-CoA O-methyltransferase
MSSKILNAFDKAAGIYSDAAQMQLRVADALVERVVAQQNPARILDLGCGTGFVAAAAQRRWPQAIITAVDAAAAMLAEVEERLPAVQIIQADVLTFQPQQGYDLIFSSMMLHWLPEPLQALKQWRRWLKPGGKLCVALLLDGSFQEWRDLCRQHNKKSGLWPMPHSHFADDVIHEVVIEKSTISYSSALEFLRNLKQTGAAMPVDGYRPATAGAMRKLLRTAAIPFPVSYQICSIALPASGA